MKQRRECFFALDNRSERIKRAQSELALSTKGGVKREAHMDTSGISGDPCTLLTCHTLLMWLSPRRRDPVKHSVFQRNFQLFNKIYVQGHKRL